MGAGLQGILTQHVNEFFRACGPGCTDPNSPAYINVIAVISACRPSDTVNPLNPMQGCRNAADQLAAIDVIDEFFTRGSRVERVYWYGAIDNGIGSEFNYLTNTIMSGARTGQTLGQVWKAVCQC